MEKYTSVRKIVDLVIGFIVGGIIVAFCFQALEILLPVLIIEIILVILSFIKKRAYLGIGMILPPIIVFLLIYQACSNWSFG